MPTIIPAILEETNIGFMEKLSRVEKLSGADRIQIDFGDGVFVPGQTLPVAEIDALNPAFHFEAHLMVKNPGDFLDYQICGFSTITVHYEAFNSPEDLKLALAGIKGIGLKAGVAVNPDTPVNVLTSIQADQYLIMSVTPGKQGQSFISATVNRVRELRNLIPYAIIEVDGGLNETNIKAVADAGADLLVVGSALVKSADIAAAYEKLKDELSKAS